jgi:hypothetical protein
MRDLTRLDPVPAERAFYRRREADEPEAVPRAPAAIGSDGPPARVEHSQMTNERLEAGAVTRRGNDHVRNQTRSVLENHCATGKRRDL